MPDTETPSTDDLAADTAPRQAVVVVETPDGAAVTVTVSPPGVRHVARFAKTAVRLMRIVTSVVDDAHDDTLPVQAIIAAVLEVVDEDLLRLVWACCATTPETDLHQLDMGEGLQVVAAWLRVTMRPKVIRPLAKAIETMVGLLPTGQTPASGPTASNEHA